MATNRRVRLFIWTWRGDYWPAYAESRALHGGWPYGSPQWRRDVGEFVQKAKKRSIARSQVTSIDDPQWQSTYPALHDFMTSDRWDKNTVRKTTTLFLFVDGGLLKACINDRDREETAFVSARTFKELFQAIEEGLQGDTLDWRVRQENGSMIRQSKKTRQARQ